MNEGLDFHSFYQQNQNEPHLVSLLMFCSYFAQFTVHIIPKNKEIKIHVCFNQ